uniref:F-box domain-containing protein n=1 Tax=Strongyloides venezuelensis TaxID=75913 RepID=A0A0K0FQH8_STRVS
MENAENMKIVFSQPHLSSMIFDNLQETTNMDALALSCKFFYKLINNIGKNKNVFDEDCFYCIHAFNVNGKESFLVSNYNRYLPLRFCRFDEEIKYLNQLSDDFLKYDNEVVIIINNQLDHISSDSVEELVNEISIFIEQIFNLFTNANTLTFALSIPGIRSFVIGRIIKQLTNTNIEKIKLIAEDIFQKFEDRKILLFDDIFCNLPNLRELKLCGYIFNGSKKNWRDNKFLIKKIYNSLSKKKNSFINFENLECTIENVFYLRLISLTQKYNIQYCTGKLFNSPFKKILASIIPPKMAQFSKVHLINGVKLYIYNLSNLYNCIITLSEYWNIKSIELIISYNLIRKLLLVPVKKINKLLGKNAFSQKTLTHLKKLTTFCIAFEDKEKKNLLFAHGNNYKFLKIAIFKKILSLLPQSITKLRIYNFDEIDSHFTEFLNFQLPNIKLLMIAFTKINDDKCLQNLKNINFLFIEGYQIISLPSTIKFFLMSMTIPANKFYKKLNLFSKLNQDDVEKLYQIYTHQFLSSTFATNNRYAYFFKNNSDWNQYIKCIQYFLEYTGTLVLHTVNNF